MTNNSPVHEYVFAPTLCPNLQDVYIDLLKVTSQSTIEIHDGRIRTHRNLTDQEMASLELQRVAA